MTRKFFIAITFCALCIPIRAAAPAARSTAAAISITVYKDPDCGCCKAWVEYLRKRRYLVDAKDTRDLSTIKANLAVPSALASCHTALVGGYIIEGHVPAEDIARLLRTKPKIAGLAVPGMPSGSPGMEGGQAVHYQVLAFTRAGKTSVFARH